VSELQLPQGFCRDQPAVENSLAIFDNWVSALPIPGAAGGTSPLFSAEQDPRPSYVKAIFGPLEEFETLELGSLEGGHTYQLERLGIKSITSIEANTESFLKCLILKEVLGLKAKFLYGDFTKYLESIDTRYDLIFACGVLYHMTDPLHLIYLMSRRTDRVFIWTHYVRTDLALNFNENFDVVRHGYKCRYYKYFYDPHHYSRRYSGLETYSCHLKKDDIIGALQHFGLDNIHVMNDSTWETGSAISIVASRSPPVGSPAIRRHPNLARPMHEEAKSVLLKKFELRYPSPQTAIDIFAGRWASDLSKVCPVVGTGHADLLVGDKRPKLAAEALGNNGGRLDGMRILEVGPLEGAHSYQLEQLGAASIIGIETNVDAFLKCLVVKEILNLKKVRFMFGDAMEFLTKTDDRFDMVFCSGVLYHMRDPVSLIKVICNVTDKCFVWTHYYNDERGNVEGIRTKRHVNISGFDAEYYELEYPDREDGAFLGGNRDVRAWMTHDGITSCFKYFGLNEVTILSDAPLTPAGACLSFAASRR
jgi:Methyltransferase domain